MTTQYIRFKTEQGAYVHNEGCRRGCLFVDPQHSRTGASTFELVFLNPGEDWLHDNSSIALKTCLDWPQSAHDKYACAEGGGGCEVIANRTEIGPWETFSVVAITPEYHGAIHSGAKIALKANNGNYLCAECGGGDILVANRTEIGPWETFTLELSEIPPRSDRPQEWPHGPIVMGSSS